MSNNLRPQLYFEYGFNERDQFEALSRGYLSHVQVRFSNGAAYAVHFYDCTRLQQDLEEELKLGRGRFSFRILP